MQPSPPPRQGEGPTHRHPGDGWVECRCGRRHWGLNGAAGVLLVRCSATTGAVDEVVLQHRATWSDEGGTWGIPGGAIADEENAVDGGLRETSEEAGIDPRDIDPVATVVLDHRDWSYTTLIALETERVRVTPVATDPESLAVAWVPIAEVARLPLLTAFAAHLPLYLAALQRSLRSRARR